MYEEWNAYSPAKNNIKEASLLCAKGLPSYGATEAEYNFYKWHSKVLQKIANV